MESQPLPFKCAYCGDPATIPSDKDKHWDMCDRCAKNKGFRTEEDFALAAMSTGATFSLCRTWRYKLWRSWGVGPSLFVIGLNPSTADESKNDPTIRRLIGYAKAWGYSGLVMLNAFAFRATDPADMRAAVDPNGPENDATIMDACYREDVLVAWGAHGDFKGRSGDLAKILEQAAPRSVFCLGKTKSGQPKHPLYLPLDTERVPWPG